MPPAEVPQLAHVGPEIEEAEPEGVRTIPQQIGLQFRVVVPLLGQVPVVIAQPLADRDAI